VLTLETAEHAASRGATVLAELCGFGLSADAHHITAPPEDGACALRAMRAAVRMAEASGALEGGAAAIDYVNAHATSTPTGDTAELAAIGALVADRDVSAPSLLVSSTKGATGHLLGAAGAVEAAFTVLALAHQMAPPTLNLESPEPAHVPNVEHATLAGGAGTPAEGRPLRAALCNSFGFGGVNVSLCFVRAQGQGGEAESSERM
jgi:3-oxoacyl-[acyl-carrier-protein] synthase II